MLMFSQAKYLTIVKRTPGVSISSFPIKKDKNTRLSLKFKTKSNRFINDKDIWVLVGKEDST